MSRRETRFYLIPLFFMFTWGAFAQTYAFKVLASKGSNTVDGKPIKVGEQITDNQVITVSEGAYLSLAHHSGKAVEVPSGVHKAKDLSGKVAQNQSITAKYAQFVVEELTQEEKSAAAARNRFQHMNKTGSVERDIAVSSVRVWLPLNSTLAGEQLLIKWTDTGNNPKTAYQVQISDLSDKVLFSSRTQAKELLVNLASTGLKNEPHLIVKVLPVDPESGKLKVMPEQLDGNILVKPDNETAEKLQAQLAEIRKEFGKNSAMGKLAEANLFEENGMIADALAAYEQAIKLSGGVEQYQTLYRHFLQRNGLIPVDHTAAAATLNK